MDYPVGICRDDDCKYAEPHRHGLDCDKACICDGIGAETQPLDADSLSECDWGYCNRVSVAERLEPLASPDHEDVWLAVCAWHAGWLDTEPTEQEGNRG